MIESNYKQWDYKLTPLPCLCGKVPSVEPSDPKTEGDAWGAVVCKNEECPVNPKVEDGCEIADMRGPGAYRDMAIRKWNKWVSGAWPY